MRTSYNSQMLRNARRAVGLNIHRRRMHQEYPLTRLAETTGLSERLLDRYEMGKDDINLHHLLRIACALRTDLKNLVTL